MAHLLDVLTIRAATPVSAAAGGVGPPGAGRTAAGSYPGGGTSLIDGSLGARSPRAFTSPCRLPIIRPTAVSKRLVRACRTPTLSPAPSPCRLACAPVDVDQTTPERGSDERLAAAGGSALRNGEAARDRQPRDGRHQPPSCIGRRRTDARGRRQRGGRRRRRAVRADGRRTDDGGRAGRRVRAPAVAGRAADDPRRPGPMPDGGRADDLHPRPAGPAGRAGYAGTTQQRRARGRGHAGQPDGLVRTAIATRDAGAGRRGRTGDLARVARLSRNRLPRRLRGRLRCRSCARPGDLAGVPARGRADCARRARVQRGVCGHAAADRARRPCCALHGHPRCCTRRRHGPPRRVPESDRPARVPHKRPRSPQKRIPRLRDHRPAAARCTSPRC